MSRLRFGVLAMVFGLVAGCEKPEVALAGGGGVSWADFQGKWLVVNYWAEWCAPCRKEIPELNRLHEENAGVVVLGVNFDGIVGERLTGLMEEMNVRFPVVLEDPGGRWDQVPPSVLPSTLIVGPDGELRDVLVGPQSYESLARAVELTAEL